MAMLKYLRKEEIIMCEQKFFRCKHCGNLVGLIKNTGVPMMCCGDLMEELIPNTVEASAEKHVPEVSAKERLVHAKIGSVAHPMTDEHHIEFIYLQTENGGQRRSLKVGSEAAAMFVVLDDKPVEVFAYCNLHGLWKAPVPCDCGCGGEHEHTEDDAPEESCCSAEFTEGCI